MFTVSVTSDAAPRAASARDRRTPDPHIAKVQILSLLLLEGEGEEKRRRRKERREEESDKKTLPGVVQIQLSFNWFQIYAPLTHALRQGDYRVTQARGARGPGMLYSS